jgi:4-hydroxy-tetrahydrodipicolinate synthase
MAAAGLAAGCDAWYSVIGGTLPEVALRIVAAVRDGRAADALAESERLAPLWRLYTEFGGSLRVVAAVAEQLGLVQQSSLPLPIRGLDAQQRARVGAVIEELSLDR